MDSFRIGMKGMIPARLDGKGAGKARTEDEGHPG